MSAIYLKSERPNEAFLIKNIQGNPSGAAITVFLQPEEQNSASEVKCALRSVRREGSVFGAVVCKPAWTFGAYCGVNQFGLAVSAQRASVKGVSKKNCLTSEDIVRLTLQSCKNAEDAVNYIIHLLDNYGQGGGSGFDSVEASGAGFLIADGQKAYLLECAGKHWALKKANSLSVIQDSLTIEKDFISASSGINNNESFAGRFGIALPVKAAEQKQRIENALKHAPQSLETMFKTLRSHSDDGGGLGFDFCLDGGKSGIQTLNSFAAFLRSGMPVVWLTNAPVPCLSVFKPVYPLKPTIPAFSQQRESAEYWKKRAYLTRAVLAGKYSRAKVREGIESLESDFVKKEELMYAVNTSLDGMADFSKECAAKEVEFFKSVEKSAIAGFVPKGYYSAMFKTESADMFSENIKVRKKRIKATVTVNDKFF